jgi:hypothetical protein
MSTKETTATIDQLYASLTEMKNLLDDYSKFILAVDNNRFIGEGDKKISLLEYAYELAQQNSEFLPHFITLEKFITDIQYFADFRSLIDLTSQIQEKLWNMTIKSADIARKETLTV